jgi:D-sedoheptulose 7-phosphate isomerase
MTVERIRTSLRQVAENFRALEALSPEVAAAAARMVAALRAGNAILFCGNGGSAADAQHLAAELVGRYLRDRPPLRALALTVDSSALTAIANDYGYEQVFARQLRGLGRPGDVLVAISTSGNSPSVVRAVEAAREMGIASIGLTGAAGGALAGLCDLCLRVPSDRTNHIQEMHIALGHLICGIVEEEAC